MQSKKFPRINQQECAGCSVCVEGCPRNCLKISAPKFHGDINTTAELIDPDRCISCGICAKHCPIDAIEMVEKDQLCIPSPVYTKRRKTDMLKTVYCRVFQAVMKVANYAMGYHMPEYIEGVGCIKGLPEMIKESGGKKCLVVTDNGLVKLGIAQRILDVLDEGGIPYVVYSDVQPNPTDLNVEAGYKLYKEGGCDALIALGGGSPMDCAKGIGAKAVHPNKSVQQLQGLLKVHHKVPLFYAIPTTSGTGSETTVAAVITDSKTHHKKSINDPSILPGYAVLDPELTIGLPPKITSTTGMDALCHAVEAYTNHTYNTPLEDDLAKKAVKLIYDNLLPAYQDGTNIEARQNMQKAAFFAGRAFTRGCVGYVHAIGHTLGGLYGVPHGMAMSIILPHVMRRFGVKVEKRLAELAEVCGMSGTQKEEADQFISWIDDMKRQMNIPVGLDMVKEEDIPQIAQWADKEANPLYPVPVVWTQQEIADMVRSMMVKK